MDIKELVKQMRFQMDMLGANYMCSSITLKDGTAVNISIYPKPDPEETADEEMCNE